MRCDFPAAGASCRDDFGAADERRGAAQQRVS
jgi:hypothetical protein